MVKNNKTCVICGNRYTYCTSCSAHDSTKPRWMVMFDCEICKDIYFTVADYKVGKINKTDCIAKLNVLNTSAVTNEVCKKVFNEIKLSASATATSSASFTNIENSEKGETKINSNNTDVISKTIQETNDLTKENIDTENNFFQTKKRRFKKEED